MIFLLEGFQLAFIVHNVNCYGAIDILFILMKKEPELDSAPFVRTSYFIGTEASKMEFWQCVFMEQILDAVCLPVIDLEKNKGTTKKWSFHTEPWPAKRTLLKF